PDSPMQWHIQGLINPVTGEQRSLLNDLAVCQELDILPASELQQLVDNDEAAIRWFGYDENGHRIMPQCQGECPVDAVVLKLWQAASALDESRFNDEYERVLSRISFPRCMPQGHPA